MIKQIQKMMNKAMHMVMLSCDTATLLITKSAYEKLSFRESMQLKMHLMGCKLCRLFNIQSEHLTHQINELTKQQGKTLSDSKKKEIQEAINQQ